LPLSNLQEAMELLANGQAAKIAMVPWSEKMPGTTAASAPEKVPAASRA
jgi:hypothetical protein